MKEKELEPSAEVLTINPKSGSLLESLDEDGGGFRFVYDEKKKRTTMYLFKPDGMLPIKFDRKVMQVARALNWTKVRVRRVVVER
jgi:hypothetical protein